MFLAELLGKKDNPFPDFSPTLKKVNKENVDFRDTPYFEPVNDRQQKYFRTYMDRHPDANENKLRKDYELSDDDINRALKEVITLLRTIPELKILYQ